MTWMLLLDDLLLLGATVVAWLLWRSGRRARDEAAALRRSEERFRSLVQNASDAMLIVDAAGAIRYQTPSVQRTLGYQPDALDGTGLLDLLHPDNRRGAQAFLEWAAVSPEASPAATWRVRHRDGAWVDVETVAGNLLEDRGVGGIVLTMRDVRERKSLEAQLFEQAFHDPLTGLDNRARFADQVTHALARARRQRACIAVLFVDLDDFKAVNDTLGHGVGDALLVSVAERLRGCVRDGDIAARLGGDEFAVLVEHPISAETAQRVATRLVAALRRPLMIDGRELFVHASVGIAISQEGGGAAEDLLRNADLAMYAAKAAGKDRFAEFQPSMHAPLVERLELKAALQVALEHGELFVQYQPTVRLADGVIVGVEALLRWRHPERGVVPPGQFIPLAEESGLILPIGRFVLEEACRQVQRWRQRLPAASGLKANVNLSARQVHEPNLVRDVAAALRRWGLPPEHLVLEITESVLLADTDVTVTRLRQLKELGVQLALDDFGTGYSSLSYLRRFPVDLLKIDRAFIEGITGGPEESALARAILRLGETLGLATCAEGVEEVGQVEVLRSLGCDLAQGFYFARPLAPDAVERLLTGAAATVGATTPA